MKKETQNNAGTGIFNCVFPEWYWKSIPSFENITRSFIKYDQISDYSELVSTAMTGWGDMLNITLDSWMRVSQKGLDIGKASLKQDEVDPEPFFDAIDLATREIAESFEAFLKKSPLAPVQEVVEAMKSAMRILEPEKRGFRNNLKKMAVFHLKTAKTIKEWAERSMNNGWEFNQNHHAWETAVQEMITAQSELIRGMLDDIRMPEEVQSKSMATVEDHAEMMEKGLAVLVTGSNLITQTLRAAAESWGELIMPQNGKGDLQKDGFSAFQERYEQMVRKTVQESRLVEMLPQWAHTGHELNAAAGQLRNTLMSWPLAAETHLKTPAPVGRKTKGGSANNPAPAEAVVE